EVDFGVSYKFQHDRVQQAAYALLADKEKTALHLKIARLLQTHTPKEKLEERLIEIVRHFNKGRELIVDEQERETLSHLNLRASKKAKKSNAFRPAFEYARAAKALLPDNAWRTSYAHCFEIHQEYADTAYLSGELEIAQIIQVLLEKSKTTLEKVRIYQMQVRQYVISTEYEKSVQVGVQALSLLGIKLSIKPGTLSVLKEIALARWNLGKRSVESLVDMPFMEDIEKQTAMNIMMELTTPAYLLGYKNLFAMLALKQVNLALRFGNSPEAAYAYIVYAGVLNMSLGDLKTSYAFGKLAVKLNEKLDDLKFRCKILYIYAYWVHGLNHHWKTTFPLFKKAVETGLQSGDLVQMGHASFVMPICETSLTLSESSKLGKENLQLVLDSKYPNSVDFGNIWQGYRHNLMGLTKNRWSLSDSVFGEDKCLASMQHRKFLTGVGHLIIAKLELYFLYEAFDEGIKLISEGDTAARSIKGLLAMQYSFYAFMTYAAAYAKMDKKKRRQALKRMKKEYKKMRKWHDHYPVNSY
ncbi:MAG: hypothetical protein GY707_19155, partial [Desulfobacteraceae bacterium]|nr:hypothetical protein [Desulfobacteraceae bacterium]